MMMTRYNRFKDILYILGISLLIFCICSLLIFESQYTGFYKYFFPIKVFIIVPIIILVVLYKAFKGKPIFYYIIPRTKYNVLNFVLYMLFSLIYISLIVVITNLIIYPVIPYLNQRLFKLLLLYNEHRPHSWKEFTIYGDLYNLFMLPISLSHYTNEFYRDKYIFMSLLVIITFMIVSCIGYFISKYKKSNPFVSFKTPFYLISLIYTILHFYAHLKYSDYLVDRFFNKEMYTIYYFQKVGFFRNFIYVIISIVALVFIIDVIGHLVYRIILRKNNNINKQ